jgi:hypothetical protein
VRPDTPQTLRRPFDLGQLIESAIALYRRHFAEFLAIACVALPLNVAMSATSAIVRDDFAMTTLISLAFTIPMLIIGSLIDAAFAGAIAEVDEGTAPDFNRAYRRVLRRLKDLVLAAIRVYGILILLSLTIIGIPFAAYLGVKWFFFPQSVILEECAWDDALSFSGDLVKGHWWRTLGIILVVGILGGLPAIAVSSLLSSASPIAAALGGAVAGIVALPFTSIGHTLLFFDLSSRGRKDVSSA